MSLINKVIHDLEDRQALTTKNEGRVFRNLSSVDNLHHKSRIFTANFFVVILFFLFSISATYALIGNRSETMLQEIVENQEAEDEATGLADIGQDLAWEVVSNTGKIIPRPGSGRAASGLVENRLKLDFSLPSFKITEPAPQNIRQTDTEKSRSRLKTIDVSGRQDKVWLNLELASSVDYRAYELSNPDRIVVEIDNVFFDGVLPDLTYHPAVRGIRIRENQSGKLLVVLDTSAAYSIDQMELLPSTQGYILSLSLRSSSEPGTDDYDRLANSQRETNSQAAHTVTQYGEMTKNISSDDIENRVERMYTDARELYRRGKPSEANKLLFDLLSKRAEHTDARSLLVKKLISQGQLDKAEKLLRQGLDIKTGEAEWTNLYARLMVNRGDVNTAITVLNSVKPEPHSNPDYYAFLAALYQKTDQHEEATAIYRQVLEVNPANGIWWMGLAISLEALRHNRDALFAYNRALQGNRMSPDLQKYVQGKINYLNKRS